MKTALDQWIREQEGIPAVTRASIEAVQLKKLNLLLKREKVRSGFYQNLPDHLEDLKQLQELPFTTEKEFREQGHRMLLLSQSQIERVRTELTSGTTGAAKRMFYSENDNNRTVSFFAAGLSELVHPGEKTMICMPFSKDRGLGELISEAIVKLGAIPLKTGIGRTYGELMDVLETEKPQTYVGMPEPLLSLLRLKPDNSLERALISGDACAKTVEKEIEGLLGTRLYPHYGSREIGLGGAVTCPAFCGMHLRENDMIAEIVDEHGMVLPYGEWGELVLTTIQAEAMPLIRYRTGDHTRIYREPCPCGSVLLRLDQVTRMGDQKEMAELDEKFFSYPWIIDYCAAFKENKIKVQGYVTEAGREPLPVQWKGISIEYKWTVADRKKQPCYLGKRRML